jgi:hypothetical protein
MGEVLRKGGERDKTALRKGVLNLLPVYKGLKIVAKNCAFMIPEVFKWRQAPPSEVPGGRPRFFS